MTFPGGAADWMCIGIEKESETPDHADYIFIADVWGSDPRCKDRSMILGQVRGLFRIFKGSGRARLLVPMPGDPKGRRFRSASHKIQKEWRTGKLPEKSMFACG